MYEDEYDADEPVEEIPVQVPQMKMPKQWSWNTETLLWSALGVLGLGFGVWFLMAYTGARARAIAAEVTGNGDSGE